MSSEDREMPGSVHEVTVAEIVVRLRLEAHGRWDRGSYLGAADLIEREFPAPVQADTEETNG